MAQAFTVPVLALAYGDSGTGRTTDSIYSFPCGLFIAEPAALKPGLGVVGFLPSQVNVDTIGDAEKVLIREARSKKYDAFVVDDFSILTERTLAGLPTGRNGFAKWDLIRSMVIQLCDVARDIGCHVILNAHRREPRTNEAGRYFRGGPSLPCDLSETLPAHCDIVLRSEVNPDIRGWKVQYRCNVTNSQYAEKDRHGSCPDPAPMNLGEILRNAGYRIRRPVGLEFIEDVAEGVAASLLAGREETAVFQNAVAFMRQKYQADDLIARWALRDGHARAALRRARKVILSEWGIAAA